MHARTEPAAERENAVSELASAVRERHRDVVRELRVEVIEGGVILYGFAYSFYGKQVAQHEVLHRTNLVLLANRITVASRLSSRTVPPAAILDGSDIKCSPENSLCLRGA